MVYVDFTPGQYNISKILVKYKCIDGGGKKFGGLNFVIKKNAATVTPYMFVLTSGKKGNQTQVWNTTQNMKNMINYDFKKLKKNELGKSWKIYIPK